MDMMLQQGSPDWGAPTQALAAPTHSCAVPLQGAVVNKSLPSLAQQTGTTISQ